MTIPATKNWHWQGRSIVLDLETYYDTFEALAMRSVKGRAGYLSWTIDLPKRPRSTGPGSASNHAHGHFQQLSMAMGVPFETAKMYIKIRAAIEMGYPSEMIKGIVLPQSEALATVEQESMLIEMCHIVASEISVALIEENE
jgi:hypothetical protein